MSSISPAVKMPKATTSLPPISDIFRGPSIPADPYYSPPSYGAYRGMPALANSYHGSQYQLATPEYVAPRYYSTQYPPSYSFAGETGYREARDSWRSSVDGVHQLPSPLQMSSHTQRSSLSEVGSRTPESESQPSAHALSPKFPASNSRVRTRNNLPKEVTHVLLKWLNDHLNHPYPNSFEKAQLIMATGLNQQQLSNWFINARRRKIKYLREKSAAQSM